MKDSSDLRAVLLGAFQLFKNGRPLPLPAAKDGRTLLAYLLLHPQPQARVRLIGLLWPDLPEKRGRRALSQALWHIRRVLPDLLEVNNTAVHIPPDRAMGVDALEFESLT